MLALAPQFIQLGHGGVEPDDGVPGGGAYDAVGAETENLLEPLDGGLRPGAKNPIHGIQPGNGRVILGDAVQPVTEELYDTEFNDYKITVKVADSLEDAMAHIAKYSTKHSECIITRDLDAAQKFQRTVDAAVVYVNASTRFTDGGEFGYGAEIGISTQKLHARGPMGLHELTTVKYLVTGSGQIRE